MSYLGFELVFLMPFCRFFSILLWELWDGKRQYRHGLCIIVLLLESCISGSLLFLRKLPRNGSFWYIIMDLSIAIQAELSYHIQHVIYFQI